MNWHFEKKQFFQWCAQNGVELPKRNPQQGQESQSWKEQLAVLTPSEYGEQRFKFEQVISDLRNAAFDRILKTDKPCAEVVQFSFGMDALESLAMTLLDMFEKDFTWLRDADGALEQLYDRTDLYLASDIFSIRQNLTAFVNAGLAMSEKLNWLLGDIENRWRAKQEEHDRQVQEEREVLNGLLEIAQADRSEERPS
jgi:hypothetical protein